MVKKSDEKLVIPAMKTMRATIRVVGLTPLLQNRRSEEILDEIEDGHKQKPKAPRGKRNPEAEYEMALYGKENGYWIHPGSAFKKAMVRAATFVGKDVKMTFLRGAFHVIGSIRIVEGEPEMARHAVVLQGKTMTTRYRPIFQDWAAEVDILFNEDVISIGQVVNIANVAGFSAGIGDWRPEKDGSHGMFKVDKVIEIVPIEGMQGG